MVAVCHLEFLKFEIFNVLGAVKRPILHQRTKFCKDRSNRCGYIVIFKMVTAAILNFQNFEILVVDPL